LERALDADAEADLADGERLLQAGALATDHDALEQLGALAGALDDADVHLERVTRVERGDVVAQAGTVDEIGVLHGAYGSLTAFPGDVSG
jgi:hypothetical protein